MRVGCGLFVAVLAAALGAAVFFAAVFLAALFFAAVFLAGFFSAITWRLPYPARRRTSRRRQPVPPRALPPGPPLASLLRPASRPSCLPCARRCGRGRDAWARTPRACVRPCSRSRTPG